MNQYAKDYYKRYKNFNYSRLGNFIIGGMKEFLDTKKDRKANLIVDVGCGIGRLADRFQQCSKTVVGLDISSDAIEMASRNNNNIYFIIGNALKLPIRDNICDICLCIHVIEHLKDFDLLLREIYRITAQSGKAIFITPNKRWTWFAPPALRDKTHVREFGPGEFKRLISNYFFVEKARPFSTFTSFGIFNPVMNALFKTDIYLSCVKR